MSLFDVRNEYFKPNFFLHKANLSLESHKQFYWNELPDAIWVTSENLNFKLEQIYLSIRSRRPKVFVNNNLKMLLFRIYTKKRKFTQ